MPTYVDPSKCDGCKGGEKTACMYICPNDLMILDAEEMKAYNQEPDACWECYSCVKICPQGAITARPYADFAPMGGTCIPMRSAVAGINCIKPRAPTGDTASIRPADSTLTIARIILGLTPHFAPFSSAS